VWHRLQADYDMTQMLKRADQIAVQRAPQPASEDLRAAQA